MNTYILFIHSTVLFIHVEAGIYINESLPTYNISFTRVSAGNTVSAQILMVQHQC